MRPPFLISHLYLPSPPPSPPRTFYPPPPERYLAASLPLTSPLPPSLPPPPIMPLQLPVTLPPCPLSPSHYLEPSLSLPTFPPPGPLLSRPPCSTPLGAIFIRGNNRLETFTRYACGYIIPISYWPDKLSSGVRRGGGKAPATATSFPCGG